ncbi:MAG: ABC transporter permease [Clostridia bacterium]|nr:ABC transporter permease [Clostridia bacterium]
MKQKSLLGRAAAAPHIVWAFLFILAPICFVIYYAFTDRNGSFTLSNFSELSVYLPVLLLSLMLALIATTICLIIGFPVAFAISRTKPTTQKILIMMLMLPMWINFIIRTDSIAILIEKNGVINSLLKNIGLSLEMMDTEGAVILGMVYDFLPYMILPIYTVMTKIDKSMIEASADLGCSGFYTTTRVIMPMSFSGICSGITMVFVPCVSTFYISQRLGGTNTYLIGDEIEAKFMSLTQNYNAGAMLSCVLMVLILLSTLIMNHYSDSENDMTKGGVLM